MSGSTDFIEQAEDSAPITGTGTALSDDVPVRPAAVVESEPVLQAAIAQPEVRKNTRRDQSFVVPNGLGAKTIAFEDIKRRLPSGWYAADSTQGHQGESTACPADGHFLWNTRHREQPVFEMGLVLEFPVNINTANVLADENGNLLFQSADMALRVGSANRSPAESTKTGNYDSTSEPNLPFVELLMLPSENEGIYQTACRFVYSGGF